ncbi:MAG: hypothetical protein GY835_02435 [bacterium]|nr:hypothetical protein [bacterium]
MKNFVETGSDAVKCEWRSEVKTFLVEVLIYQLLAAILAYGSGGEQLFLKNLPIYLVICNCIAFSIRTHFYIAQVKWDFIRWRRSRQILYATPAVVSGCAIGSGLALAILLPIYGKDAFGKMPFLMLLKGSVIVGAAVTVLILGYNILQDKLTTESLAKERAKSLQTQAELAALQSKLDPHFLFNTLNTMLNLVHTEPGKVEEMILSLSDIYRKILQLPARELISLADEFALVDQYLKIERIRLGDRLAYSLDLPTDLAGREVPPLLLQPLVENAIVHGLGPKPAGGAITILAERYAEGIRIVVSDDGVGLQAQSSGAGFGLHSIRERLRLQYGDRSLMRIEAFATGGAKVTLEIPDDN